MARLRVPTALSITLLAAVSCTPSPSPSDAADEPSDTAAPMDVAMVDSTMSDTGAPIDVAMMDTAIEDVPTSCDAVPFVSYCVPTQADSGVNCGPSRVCQPTECTQTGCSFCSFPVECHRNDATTSYCFTTCESSQCTGECPLIA